jgi:hypothetical protein
MHIPRSTFIGRNTKTIHEDDIDLALETLARWSTLFSPNQIEILMTALIKHSENPYYGHLYISPRNKMFDLSKEWFNKQYNSAYGYHHAPQLLRQYYGD